MRSSAKKRIQFFIVTIIVYCLGFQFLPETLRINSDLKSLFPVIIASIAYFILLPTLHWFWVIKAGQQKAWKIILIFSLSSLVARYSFPTDIALYFEFILYLRYPIIAILLIVELYLMVMIVKGLWQARNLSGDPRIHAAEKYKDDEKKLAMALPFSWEPASWYYAIPKFSKKHSQSICQLQTSSISRVHWLMLIAACFAVGCSSYILLIGWSEVTAIIIASLAFYSVVFITANHRVARNYSVYILGDSLIVNNAFWSFSAIKLNDINSINLGRWHKSDDKEQLMLGKGEYANIELTFFNQQTYLGSMGQFPEKISKIWLNVDQPECLAEQLKNLRFV